MSQSKKENLHKKIYYPDCRAYPSKDAVLADMKKRRGLDSLSDTLKRNLIHLNPQNRLFLQEYAISKMI